MVIEFFREILDFISSHPLVIKAATGFAAGCCATVILSLRSQAVSAERWAKYFGWAFLIYAIEYTLQFATGYAEGHSFVPRHLTPFVTESVRYIAILGSSAHNLFFLAAALKLLNHKRVFPWWAWAFASFGLVGVIDESLCPWCRLPDAVFSVICLSAVGFATFVNLSFRRRQPFAVLAMVVAGLYTLVQLAYGLTPLLVKGILPGLPEIWGLLERSDPMAAQRILDTFILVVSLPLKFGLFFVGLVLLMKAIVVISSNTAIKMLDGINNGRLEYLSTDGIVKSIGQSLDADRVELSLRIPGLKEERVALFKWDRAPVAIYIGATLELPSIFRPGQKISMAKEPMIMEMPHTDKSIVGRVLKKGKQVKYPGRHTSPDTSITHITDLEGKSTLVAVPVYYHGGVIGCLSVEWRTTEAFNATAFQHVKEWANLLSPAIQSYREMAALDQLSYRFTRWQVEAEPLQSESSIREIAETLQDILSPLATGIVIDFGFESFKHVCGNAEICAVMLKGSADHFIKDHSDPHHSDITSHEILISSLVVTRKTAQDKISLQQIGELALIVPSQIDQAASPILGTNDFHRRTISAMVANTLLDVAREYLGSVLKDLGVNLNRTKEATEANWLREVNDAAKKAGILWTLDMQMEESDANDSLEWKRLISELPEERHTTQDAQSLICFDIKPSVRETHHVIAMRLPITGRSIWFGVGREGFGPELDFPSPWKVFLERLAEIAESALIRLAAAREFQGLQMKTIKAQGLATVAATTGTLFHQLANLIRDIANPISTLKDAVNMKKLTAEGDLKELILSLHESTEYLLKFAAEIKGVTNMDSRRPCSLWEAAMQSEKLYTLALAQCGINMEIRIEENLVVDVPFYVASLALANLVENAKDALKGSFNKNGGCIRIEAEDAGDMIHCRIIDNGPGIDPSMIDRLFDIGVTTKQDSGGWGLYLIKHSLMENRGDILLAKTDSSGTTFTIRFPKERQENFI